MAELASIPVVKPDPAAVAAALRRCGGPAAVARVLGLDRSAPQQWRRRGRVPLTRAIAWASAFPLVVKVEDIRMEAA